LNTALTIWGIYCSFNILSHVSLSKEVEKGFYISMSAMSLMGGAALIWTGHTSWFLGLNLALIGLLVMVALAQLGISPPSADNHKASIVAQAATLRLAVVLACWFLAK